MRAYILCQSLTLKVNDDTGAHGWFQYICDKIDYLCRNVDLAPGFGIF
jgi:hypothetical protein